MDRLYIFNSITSKCFKVGVSNDIKRRLFEIRSQGYEIDEESSFFSNTQDKKFIYEVEKILKFLLKEQQIENAAGKESGFSEWFSSSETINALIVGNLLNSFFEKRLGLVRDTRLVPAGSSSLDFDNYCTQVTNILSEKNKLKGKYVDLLIASFCETPLYLLHLLGAMDSKKMHCFAQRDGKGLAYHIQNDDVKLEDSKINILMECLDSAERVLDYYGMAPEHTWFYELSMSSEQGIANKFHFKIHTGMLRDSFEELRPKIQSPEMERTIYILETLLALVCRDPAEPLKEGK